MNGPLLGVDHSNFSSSLNTKQGLSYSSWKCFFSPSLNSTVGSNCYSLMCFALLDISEPMEDDPEIIQAYERRVNAGQNPEGFFEGIYAYLEDMGMYSEFKRVFQSVKVG